eukprot:gene18185-19999_t
MVVNYNSDVNSMYSEFSIVPENTYSSPGNSPFSYSSYDAANSPASSDISSVDSAFDELAGVIPELDPQLSGDESPKYYKDLSPYPSPGYCEESESTSEYEDVGRATLSLYDSYNALIDNSLVKQMRNSAKRQLPADWYEDSCSDLSSVGIETNAKHIRLSDAAQMAENTKRLLASGSSKTLGEQLRSLHEEQYESPMSSYADSLSSYSASPVSPFAVGLGSPYDASPVSPEFDNSSQGEEQELSDDGKDQGSLFFLNEELLTKHFETLAEYISKDVQSKPVQPQKEEKSVQESAPLLKKPSPLLLKEVKKEPLFDLARYQEAALAQYQSTDAPVMFSMSNSNALKSDPKKLSLTRDRANNVATLMTQKFKIPVEPRRARLCLQSTTKPRLYNFLLELLQDPDRYPCIEWIDEARGIFKFLDSARIAGLWGLRKNKPHMKYENFARSLRTYIAKGILKKPRNKLVYQFTSKFI